MKIVERILVLALLTSHLSLLTSHAQVGTWHAYMSYYQPQQIVKAGDHHLFVRASNDLYSYNLNDHSITTYDKVNTLSDTYITHIAWNAKAARLIIVYQNSNIDLLTLDGNATNISSLYSKTMTRDKTVNNVYIHDVYAYLATGFGIVKINMQRAEVAESYILNHNVTAVDIADGILYAKAEDTNTPVTLAGAIGKNLIDSHNWTTTLDYPDNLFTVDLTHWNQYIDHVRTLQPGGPRHNYFGFLNFKDGVLYSCGGGYNASIDLYRDATVQIYHPHNSHAGETGDSSRDNEWSFLQSDMTGVPGTESPTWAFVDMLSVDVDPFDSRHIFAGGRPGLYEYYDGKLVKYYNKDNSILQPATSSNRFVLVESVKYDEQGNLWLLQSQVTKNSIILLPRGGELTALPQPEVMDGGRSLSHLRALLIDRQGMIWFANDYWTIPSVWCYDPKTNRIINSFKELTNQDGTAYSLYRPRCLAQDFDGNIWIGTNIAPFIVDHPNLYTQGTYVTQVKVPRNDGSNYADYLLNGANIADIAIDGAGRKWIATYGDGIYLISADNMQQIQHFTTTNSPLLSDNVEALAIDNTTGQVFIGTENGLCSYISDATEAAIEMDSDNVYAYPNPVISGYDGLITIVGLSLNADVKILTANGQLVAQGRSNGGTFTWDGRNRQGQHVAAGIYIVAAANSQGKKGAVCKIAIVR